MEKKYIVESQEYKEAIELLKKNEDINKEISVLQDEIDNLKKIYNDKIKERDKTELYLDTKQSDKNYQTINNAVKSNKYWYNEVTNEIIRVEDFTLGIKFTDFIKGKEPHCYSSSAKRILTSCPIPITEEYFNKLIASENYRRCYRTF